MRYVLMGSVRRMGQHLRVTAQLIDGESKHQVWSERLNEAMSEVLSMQDAIAAKVVGSLIPELLQAEQQRAARLPINNVLAYELALKGSNLISQGVAAHDVDTLSNGIALAQEAMSLDPVCLRAYYAMAWGYCRRGTMGYIGVDAAGDLEHAMSAALRLHDLEPRNHAAYAIIGHIDVRLLRHESSPINLRQAHNLNVNDAVTLRWLSWEEANHGLARDARTHAEMSIALSPRDRFLDQSYWALALSAYVAGDLAECITNARRAIALNRLYGGHHVLLVAVLSEAGASAEAGEIAANLFRNYPGLLERRLQGRTYFVDPVLTSRYQAALERAASRQAADPTPRTAPAALSGREQEVLRMVSQGSSNAAIASALALSEHTVKRHVANILTKLDVPTRAAAVAHAARIGLL